MFYTLEEIVIVNALTFGIIFNVILHVFSQNKSLIGI